MPACKVGCCPDNICECSNDCECLLSKDVDFSEKVDFENPLLIAEHNLKGIPLDSPHRICPCRTKEELAEYVKPIEPLIHLDDNMENTPAKTDEGDDIHDDGVWKKNTSIDAESGTQAQHGYNVSHPPEHLKPHHHTVGKSYFQGKSCGWNSAKNCYEDKSCGTEEVRNLAKPTGGKYCDDNNSDVNSPEKEKHSRPTGGKNCDDESCEVKSHGQEKDSKPTREKFCDEESCGVQETHKHSKPAIGSCYEDEKCRADKSSKEGPMQPCRDDQSCEENGDYPVKKSLPRQDSVPSKPSSNPNSPSKIAKPPNFEIRSNPAFGQSLQVPELAPYRKMKRSQSLAEARLGSLLNERRPSCFQLQMSSTSLRSGRLPDPHHGHDHHHIHEYHHAKCGYHSQGLHHHHHELRGERDHHDDCCSGSNSFKVDTSDLRISCCEDPDCDGRDQSHSSHEELKPLVKAEEAKVEMDKMIIQTTKLRVQNMCCPKEGQIVQDELRKLEGIENIRVNVIGRVAHVSHFPYLVSPTTIMNALNKRHLGASIVDTGSEAEMEDGLPRPLKIRLANLAFQAVLVALALVGTFTSSSWYMWVAIVEICFGIFPVLKKVYRAVRNLEIDLNILITITVIGTLAIQEWVEGAAVVFVFTIAGFLQRYCFYRVQKTISSLMLSKPSKAVMACTGECIPIEDVPIGSIIAVRQGELIPLDGIVVKGVASVDESSISGESTPVEKILECPAYSGTVIQNGYLEIETTSSSTSSTISKISAMVEDAQMNVSPTEIMVNKFAKFYTPLVIVASALVFLIPLFLGLGGVEAYEDETKTWGERALIILVTACPCALLMATPTVVICGINGAARLGALIKGGTYLEALGQLNLLAFDKTGTLTEGKFQVVDLIPAGEVDESDALRWAAAIESKSSHPLAAAVVNEFTGECVSVFVNDSDFLPDVSEFCTMEGQGISGKVEGHDVQVGNRSLLEKLEITLSPKFETAYISFCDDAKTVIFVCVDGKLALMISLADIIRWESRDALTWLQELGVHLCMLTGDAKQTANAVQKELQLDSVVSDMKPDDKLNWITNVKEQDVRRRRFGCFKKRGNHIVGMVGDGVNDGPALAASDVGIAMAAGGSALAVEAAGVALMNNNVLKVPEMICLSRFCRRVILQNIILSVLLKLVFVVVALTGFVRVWMAVLADLVGLVAVILNGLRPLRWEPPRTKKKSEPPRASFRRKRPLLMYETVV